MTALQKLYIEMIDTLVLYKGNTLSYKFPKMNTLAKIKKEDLESKTLFLVENNQFVEKEVPRGKRCDMHCHDRYNCNPDGSVMYTGTPFTKGTGFGVGFREGYGEPEEIYRIAKARGMDFVTISSHNSIQGAIELIGKYEDAYVSAEYDVKGSPDGHIIHVIVSGHEFTGEPRRVHKKLLVAAPKGHDYFIKMCQDFGLFYGLAHPAWLASPKLELKPEYFHSWLEAFSHWEINGSVQLENKLAKRALDMFLEDGKTKNVYAGGDCHHLHHVGITFTETLDSKIETPKEFLHAVKKGEVGIGSYQKGGFSERFHGPLHNFIEDTFQGVKHYLIRENHLRKRILVYNPLSWPIIVLSVATIPYVMTFLESVQTEHRTKKLAKEYFNYLESLETKPLEEKIEDILEEKHEIRKRYKEAKDAIDGKSLITLPGRWGRLVIKLLSGFNVFKADYNFSLDDKKEDTKMLEKKQE